jgi:hypothetical protein
VARYQFGTGEELHCITDVKLKGAEGQELCLAYKTSTYSLFLPLYLKDDGYVLSVKSRSGEYYELPQGQELAEFQANGSLPAQLPTYTIPLLDYAFGYSLPLVVVVVTLVSLIQYQLKQRRKASLETQLPPGQTPLELKTKADRWLHEEVAKLLGAGERVEQQAYGFDREDVNAVTSAYYAVLTTERLIVLQSRVGAFGPLLENRGVVTHVRKSIEHVVGDERHLHFVFTEAPPFDFFAEWSERHLSNQRRFLADVPRLFPRPAAELSAGLEPA